MSIRFDSGATRFVILVGEKFAIKIARPTCWRLFLHGILANLQEREFSATGWPQLCPTCLSDPLGFGLVMHYARPLTDQEWAEFAGHYPRFVNQEDYRVPVEFKRNSFGIFQGRIVAIDYGT